MAAEKEEITLGDTREVDTVELAVPHLAAAADDASTLGDLLATATTTSGADLDEERVADGISSRFCPCSKS